MVNHSIFIYPYSIDTICIIDTSSYKVPIREIVSKSKGTIIDYRLI